MWAGTGQRTMMVACRQPERAHGSPCYLGAMTTIPTPPSDPILGALAAHGASIDAVRYRPNRSVLLSISRDGRTLNSHACFRNAPEEIARAIARWATSPRGSRASSSALARLREWEGTRRGLAEARRASPRRRRGTEAGDVAPLRALFDGLNETRFDCTLPDIPLRISRRMTRSLGTTRYGGGPGAATRTVVEIALSADLLLPGNRALLEDTMAHEMAHAEAWLRHGHRGHGREWRRIAERVGATPSALCRQPVQRQRRS